MLMGVAAAIKKDGRLIDNKRGQFAQDSSTAADAASERRRQRLIVIYFALPEESMRLSLDDPFNP